MTWRWHAFARLWLKVGLAMKDPIGFRQGVEMYERWLARANEATAGWLAGTREGLITYAEWEMWNAIYALNPEAASRGEPEDTFHAGCCALRAQGALSRLRRLA